MKKLISILCITLLLCSALAMTVSAAGTGTIEDPVVCNSVDLNMVKIPAGKTYYVSFTDAAAAAKRQISINSTTDKEAGYSVTYGSTIENSDANGYCNLIATPDATFTYPLSITNNSAKQATFFINFYEISPYEISETPLYPGENAVTTLNAEFTLFAFAPEETANYEVTVDNAAANLSHWNGSIFYVTGLAQEAVDGKLTITCNSVGQTLLIGLKGVDAANITITKVDDYVPPASVEYVTYVNKHTPSKDFTLPDGELIQVDITTAQTVVLGADGIYRYGSANGPIVVVDMTGVVYADLYECYYPSAAEPADRLRGTYVDADGKTCGYDFVTAMKDYADALDANGFYYLTEDLANYLQMYGKDQGWYLPEYSPFEVIKADAFNADSAWLVSAYYIPSTAGSEPIIPDEPDTPDSPDIPDEPDAPADDNEEPESPATGDVTSFGALAALLISAVGTLTFSKKRK